MINKLKYSFLPLIAAALFTPSNNSPMAQGNRCDLEDRDKQYFKIKIRVRENAPRAVTRNDQDEDSLHVCLDDEVEWMMQGQARRFFINFKQGAPFAGGTIKISNNGKVTVVIGGDAQRGNTYKYHVGLDGGGELDPHIVVD